LEAQNRNLRSQKFLKVGSSKPKSSIPKIFESWKLKTEIFDPENFSKFESQNRNLQSRKILEVGIQTEIFNPKNFGSWNLKT